MIEKLEICFHPVILKLLLKWYKILSKQQHKTTKWNHKLLHGTCECLALVWSEGWCPCKVLVSHFGVAKDRTAKYDWGLSNSGTKGFASSKSKATQVNINLASRGIGAWEEG